MSPLEKEMSLLSTEELLIRLDSGALDPVRSAIARRILYERRNESALERKDKLFSYIKALAGVVAVFVFVSQFDGAGDHSVTSVSESSTQSLDYPSTSTIASDESEVENSNLESASDGDHECVVMNVSRGNGPYNLECEKDGDEITIRFPNGGYVVVDENGYEASRGEQWSVQFDD